MTLFETKKLNFNNVKQFPDNKCSKTQKAGIYIKLDLSKM